MKILAIDTSGSVCGVALVDGEKTVAECCIDYQKTHSQVLMPMIESLLRSVEADLSMIEYIACSAGPGSFTGLRIGASTAKALAQGANKKIVSVPTLDALAYNVFDTSKIIIPLMDARRAQVYTAFYRWDGLRPVRLMETMAEDIDNILAMADKHKATKVFLGDGADAYMEKITASGVDFVRPPANMNRQRAASVGNLAVAMLASGEEAVDYKEFVPIYIRKPQAEREYEERMSVSGAPK